MKTCGKFASFVCFLAETCHTLIYTLVLLLPFSMCLKLAPYKMSFWVLEAFCSKQISMDACCVTFYALAIFGNVFSTGLKHVGIVFEEMFTCCICVCSDGWGYEGMAPVACEGAVELVDLCTPPRVQVVGAAKPALSGANAEAQNQRREMALVLAEDIDDGDLPKKRQKKKPQRKNKKGQPKKKTQKKGKKAANTAEATGDADMAGDAVPVLGDPAQEGEKAQTTIKLRTRCRKRALTEEGMKMACVKQHLASLGVTWGGAQNFHNRYPVDEFARECLGKSGFVTMHTELSNLALPECRTCVAMLHHSGFKMENLETEISKCLDPTMLSPCTKLRKLLQPLPPQPVEAQPLQDGSVQADDLQQERDRQPNGDEGPDENREGNVQELEGQDEDVWQIVRDMRCLVVLPVGTHGKNVPIRCLACKSNSQRDGKVFDAVLRTKKNIQWFVKQHCRSALHVASIGPWMQAQSNQPGGPDDPPDAPANSRPALTVPCHGLSLTHGSGHLVRYKGEFQLWAQHTNLSSPLSKHKYIWNIHAEELLLMHRECRKIVKVEQESEKAVCDKCWDAENCARTQRNALRFAKKWWVARILLAKMFKSEEIVCEIEAECKQTALYKLNTRQMNEILALDMPQMQAFVRKGFFSIPNSQMSTVLQTFMETTVSPITSVNIGDCTSEMRMMSYQFTSLLASSQLSELDALGAKIAEAACKGTFQQRPAVLGLICQCLDAIDREERNVPSLKKARNMTEREREVVADAGALLAMNGASAELMKYFGFSRKGVLKCHGSVNNLLEQGLPSAALCLLDERTVNQNAVLVDSLSPRLQGQVSRRFVLSFDFTYLLKLQTQMKLFNKQGLVGSPFSLADLNRENRKSFQNIKEDGRVDLVEKAKANRMMLGFGFSTVCHSLQNACPMHHACVDVLLTSWHATESIS